MKIPFVAIFISVVLIFFSAINYYIFIRGWQALPEAGVLRKIYLPVFIIFASSFFAGRIIERFYMSFVSDFFVWLGAFWLAFMLYFFLLILLLDILRLINHFIPFFPSLIIANYCKAKLIIAFSGFVILILLIGAGFANALNIRIRKINIEINKPASHLKTLNIVMASDVHLGTINNRTRFTKVIEKINSLNPDIVFFAGDLVDEDVTPVIRHNLGDLFGTIRSKYGIYAITGNHEYIGGAKKTCAYLSDHGINMLKDTVVKIDDSFYIIGREDKDMPRFTGKERKTLNELMKEADTTFPVIVLNHQPNNPREAANAGADLQLSGHTHDGQMFPFNLLVRRMYQISYGYRKINNTHFYVSSGVGTWAPPVRIGSNPEIVNIMLNFR